VAKAPHQRIQLLRISGLCGKGHQAFPKGGIQGFSLGPGNQARLLDQLLISTQSNFFYTTIVCETSASRRASASPVSCL
jgi:hypothetical protein